MINITSLKRKIILSFLLITLIFSITSLITVYVSETALKDSIETENIILAKQIMSRIDMHIGEKIEMFNFLINSRDVEQALKQSNKEYSKRKDLFSYIKKQDKLWINTPKDEYNDLMKKILNTHLSQNLIYSSSHFFNKYGYKAFGEIFITNRYGVNIAMTNRTSDFYQADEKWWHETRKNKIYVENINYDKSSRLHSIVIGIRIDDEKDDFLGAVKIVLNIEDIIKIFKQIKKNIGQKDKFNNLDYSFELITADGRKIFSTEKNIFFEKIDDNIYKNVKEKLIRGDNYFVLEKDNKTNLYTFAESQGGEEFKGLGWIIIIKNALDNIFLPVKRMERTIIIIIVFSIISAVLLIILISTYLTKPVLKIKEAALKIKEGDFSSRADVKTKDELGFLSEAFNEMAEKIEKSYSEIKAQASEMEKLNTELSRTKDELEEANLKLKDDIKDKVKDLQKTQHQLIYADKLSSIGQASSEVCHEFKNILAIIRMNIELLLLKDNKEYVLSDNAVGYIEKIKKSLSRGSDIISNIMYFSKPRKEEYKVIAIENIINNIIKFQIEFLKKENITVITEYAASCNVNIDPGQIEQVFLNFFINARHSIKKTGSKQGKIVISTKDLADTVEIRFKDNGLGIKKENLQRIFEPFFTTKEIDTGSKIKVAGSGLGLSVSKNIIETHKGTIKVESKFNEGACFIINLPKA